MERTEKATYITDELLMGVRCIGEPKELVVVSVSIELPPNLSRPNHRTEPAIEHRQSIFLAHRRGTRESKEVIRLACAAASAQEQSLVDLVGMRIRFTCRYPCIDTLHGSRDPATDFHARIGARLKPVGEIDERLQSRAPFDDALERGHISRIAIGAGFDQSLIGR